MKSKIHFFIYTVLSCSTIIFLYQTIFFKNKLDDVKIHLREAKQELKKINELLAHSHQQIETAMLHMEITQQEANHIKTQVDSVNKKRAVSKSETKYLLDSLRNNVLKEFESIEAIKTELSKFE